MEGKWTKGPWHARGSYVYGHSGETVASVLGYYEANARLIAQAPAMADALENAETALADLGACDDPACRNCPRALATVRAILAAIKGRVR